MSRKVNALLHRINQCVQLTPEMRRAMVHVLVLTGEFPLPEFDNGYRFAVGAQRPALRWATRHANGWAKRLIVTFLPEHPRGRVEWYSGEALRQTAPLRLARLTKYLRQFYATS